MRLLRSRPTIKKHCKRASPYVPLLLYSLARSRCNVGNGRSYVHPRLSVLCRRPLTIRLIHRHSCTGGTSRPRVPLPLPLRHPNPPHSPSCAASLSICCRPTCRASLSTQRIDDGFRKAWGTQISGQPSLFNSFVASTGRAGHLVEGCEQWAGGVTVNVASFGHLCSWSGGADMSLFSTSQTHL